MHIGTGQGKGSFTVASKGKGGQPIKSGGVNISQNCQPSMFLTKESMLWATWDTGVLETENKTTACKIIDRILFGRLALNLNMQDIFSPPYWCQVQKLKQKWLPVQLRWASGRKSNIMVKHYLIHWLSKRAFPFWRCVWILSFRRRITAHTGPAAPQNPHFKCSCACLCIRISPTEVAMPLKTALGRIVQSKSLFV